jgi:hypothetical protein
MPYTRYLDERYHTSSEPSRAEFDLTLIIDHGYEQCDHPQDEFAWMTLVVGHAVVAKRKAGFQVEPNKILHKRYLRNYAVCAGIL